MNKFLTTHRLCLTPLSPIHIGCGEDFEPTNYVIENGILYGFDPSRAALDARQREQLQKVANQASLLGLQKFFRDHAPTFKPYAQALIPVSRGVTEKYESGIGRAANVERDGNRVFNQFFIERASYTGAEGWPYVPGSSFKGCLRTAWVDKLNGENQILASERDKKRKPKSDIVERRLLQGDFATSPLRLLKVADFMPCREPQRQVLYAVNRKKDRILKGGQELQPKGIAARKEIILPGQYRAFVAEMAIPSLAPHSNLKLPLPSLEKLACHANTYHIARWQEELKTLRGRGFVDEKWLQSVEQLLAGELGKKLEKGRAMLVRLGRYGGAESKTLSGVSEIKIMQGKGQSPKYEAHTHTVWLAAENEDAQNNMLPFGWAVVEIDPEGDLPPLQDWCRQQSQGRPDMEQLRANFEAEKADAARRKAEEAAQRATQAKQAAAEEAQAQARAQALQNLSPHMRDIETMRDKCEAVQKKGIKEKANPGAGGIYQNAIQLSKAALDDANGWAPEEKTALADMLEEALPHVIEFWDKNRKDHRKKLRLAALRGQA